MYQCYECGDSQGEHLETCSAGAVDRAMRRRTQERVQFDIRALLQKLVEDQKEVIALLRKLVK